jgi:microcystin-dependent protein
MADVTISELTNRQPNSSAVFPYSEGGTTYNAALSNILPRGLISMWYGSLATIPTGWALCNGSNGTPDLRNQFVIGASVDVSGQSQTGITGANTKTGGTKDAIVVSHTHDITDNGHNHTGALPNGSIWFQRYTVEGSNRWPSEGSPGAFADRLTGTTKTGVTINSQGSSGTNQNLPPYYALAYIMKL